MNLPDVLRGILSRRGITTEEQLEKFLNPALGDLARPDELPGIAEASESVVSVVKCHGKIVVFGDYDCDGICATAILVRTLRAIGGCVEPFLPKRLDEGYGMGMLAVERMIEEHPDVKLVITVDNGINSVERVDELKTRGIGVVVTDHHLPGEKLPDCPVVNPKVKAPPFLENLCGASVAFMLANAIVNDARTSGIYNGGKIGGELLILAGLATVTDIMPLVGENRVLVSEAMKYFRRIAPIGLLELYDRAARSGTNSLTAKDFAFLLGPRINAAGRMSNGLEALDLIMATDREVARAMAQKVDELNVERKAVEQRMVDAAEKLLVKSAPAQIIDLDDGHPGVSGIVAARMMDRLEGEKVPVCVIVNGRGSARAPDGYNVRDAFVAAAEALEDYGGHTAAGGFNVRAGQIENFRRLFTEACVRQRAQLAEQGIESGRITADAKVTADDVTLELAEAVQLLEPFGEGNEEPVFEIAGVNLIEVRPVGSDGRHLGLSVRTGTQRLRAIWWNAGDRVEEFRAASGIPFDAYFHLGVSDYQERHPELRIVDLVPVQ